MVRQLLDAGSLFTGGGWVVAGLLAAALCAYRARQQGASVGLWASLGWLLGPGAYPVVWAITQGQRESGEAHPGFSPASRPPHHAEDPQALEELAEWERFYQVARQLALWLFFATVGGVLCLLIVHWLLPVIPIVYPPDPNDYETQRAVDWWYRTTTLPKAIWAACAVVGPSLAYLAHTALNSFSPTRMDRLWALYAWRAWGPTWRQHVPAEVSWRCRRLPDPTQEQLAGLRQQRDALNDSLYSPHPALIPGLAAGALLGALGVTAGCFWAYMWMANTGG